MTRASSCFLLALLVLTGCPPATTCEETPVEPTGDLAVDILGSWDGFGTDSRIVYVFEDGGAFRWIEPPNSYAPDGLEGGWDYSVDADIVTFEYPDADPSPMQAVITAETLVLTTDWESADSYSTTWTRSDCSGFGY